MTTTPHGQVPNKYLTVVYRDIAPGQEARELICHPKMSASSWSHALNDRDAAIAQVSTLRTAHIQNPAEIEHVAGDVSKNGAESNMTGSAMHASRGQAPAQAAPAAVAGPSLQHLHDLLYTAQRTTGDAQAQAIAEARIALSDLMTAPEPVLATRAWPKVSGVSRDEGHPRALLVFFSTEPTDDEMRAVHGTLAAAPTTKPAPQQEAQEPVAWYVTGCGRLLDEAEAKAEARHIGGTARAIPLYTAPQPSPTPQADSQPAPDLDIAVMRLAESVGLIGPASRTHDLHAAVQRFHDLICVNATIKAAVMAADVIRGAAMPDLQDAVVLLRKYRKLCQEIGRGDSTHLDRIEVAAVAVQTVAARKQGENHD